MAKWRAGDRALPPLGAPVLAYRRDMHAAYIWRAAPDSAAWHLYLTDRGGCKVHMVDRLWYVCHRARRHVGAPVRVRRGAWA